MKVNEITSTIEAYAPLAYQESYDNSGMQVGDPGQDISGVLITLDVTEEVIDEAIRKGCNLIIAHHPLIFRGQKKICGYNYIERCIIKAIKHDIAIYASHTCMDKTIGGVSAKMAEKLGMTEIRPLEEEKYGEQIVGLGIIGTLPQAEDAMDFLQRVKKTFQADGIRHTSLGKGKKVRRVALCGGSASEFIGKAIAAQADIYITADVKYHQFFEVEDHIILADIGHFESEQFTKEIFY